jgi:hypothetical protein
MLLTDLLFCWGDVMSNKVAVELGRKILENAIRKANDEFYGPYTFERIDSIKDGVNYRICDGNDNRVATRYTEKDAKSAVGLLNSGIHVPVY